MSHHNENHHHQNNALSFEMANLGIESLMDALDKELIMKVILQKVKPYAIVRTQYDIL